MESFVGREIDLRPRNTEKRLDQRLKPLETSDNGRGDHHIISQKLSPNVQKLFALALTGLRLVLTVSQ
jgi:hypothetical protein